MDEVDNIIIHTLRQIGCNIDEDVISLSSLSPELLVETVARCLSKIKPSLSLPKSLPSGMAQRFAVTAALADACVSVGFRGDIGYQTFLYSNVTEVRRVFMFLIERLPKESEKLPLAQPLDKISALENEIFYNIRAQLTSPWTPEYCNKLGVKKIDSNNTVALTSESIKFRPQVNLNVPHSIDLLKTHSPDLYNYWLKRSPNIFQQTTSCNICPSVIHKNDIELCNYENESNQKNAVDLIRSMVTKTDGGIKNFSGPNQDVTTASSLENSFDKLAIVNSKSNSKNKSSTMAPEAAAATTTTTKAEPISYSSNSSNSNNSNNNEKVNLIKSTGIINEINIEIEKLKNSLEELLSQRKVIQAQILKLKNTRIQQDNNLLRLKDERKIKERSCILLENPELNMSKMESIISATRDRMKKLSEQWEEHRRPLAEALEKSKTQNSNKFIQNKAVMEQMKTIRDKSVEISDDLKIKTAVHSQLLNELQKVDKTISRNAYTTRILEIVGNIRKQKNDIDKVLRDTRELQKQINNISGQLDRQFTVTDDLLYKTAKRDEYSKKAYKLLATLHSDCSELVSLVQETGAVMREIRDLEDQIENEKVRNISTNLEKITKDLKQMERESKELQEKIRKVENQITQG